jgi:phospholipid/cholesterol/gamma-HCH transport system substrate-binding protein
MSAKQGPSLSELKVGLFVVIACAILALAIFAIGSQVGMFEEQFWAKTYLNNISGLKPGDVVLFGGVEVGNVVTIEITPPNEEPPSTVQNQRIMERVARLLEEIQAMRRNLEETEQALEDARENRQRASQQFEPGSPELTALAERISTLNRQRTDLLNRIHDREDEIGERTSNLQNVLVEMRINSEYRDWVREDSNISLGSIGLLGDKYIEISLGRTDRPALTEEIEVNTWFGTEIREYVVIMGTQQASFAELITGANDILANFETLSDQVQEIMRSFESGEGTIGRLINDPSFYDNLNNTVSNANRAMAGIADLVGGLGEGTGTIGRLVKEDVLYQKITSATDRIDELLQKVNKGEGTIGRLVNDDSVYEGTDKAVANIGQITEKINKGEGTLGKLATDDQLYVSLRQSIDELSLLIKDVQEGKGTLGRLAKDEELYRNINTLSSEMVKLLYDFRQDPKKFLTIKFELF